jgi:hypothetical protein
MVVMPSHGGFLPRLYPVANGGLFLQTVEAASQRRPLCAAAAFLRKSCIHSGWFGS